MHLVKRMFAKLVLNAVRSDKSAPSTGPLDHSGIPLSEDIDAPQRRAMISRSPRSNDTAFGTTWPMTTMLKCRMHFAFLESRRIPLIRDNDLTCIDDVA